MSRLVTIVVPCFNEAPVIQAKVRNCRSLHTGGARVDVLVVDDHSTDATAAAAASAGARVIPNPGARGKWAAIRAGAAASEAEILCITDADVLMEKPALARALKRFDDPSVAAVCGLRRMVRRTPEGRLESADGLYDAVRKAMIVFYSLLDSSPALCGPMMLVRRWVVDRVEAGRLRADDVDLPVQIRKLGFKAKVCAGARFVEFELPSAARAGQAQRRALGLAQAYWRHRSALFDLRLAAFGLVAYPIEFAFFFLGPFALLAAVAAAFLCALTGSLWGWMACAVLCAEEIGSLLLGRFGAIAMNVQMLRAIWSYVFGRASVDGSWQPPAREG